MPSAQWTVCGKNSAMPLSSEASRIRGRRRKRMRRSNKPLSPRHCERSEAIHRATSGEMDCFVATLLAMTECAATSIDDGHRLDLDQPFRGRERRYTDERARRRLHAFEEHRARLADDGTELRLVADHEGGDLHDISITPAGGFQRQADIVHHLCRLRGQIPLADHPSLIVGRYLSRDIDRARACSGDDVGISRIVVKAAWPDMFELAHVFASRRAWLG